MLNKIKNLYNCRNALFCKHTQRIQAIFKKMTIQQATEKNSIPPIAKEEITAKVWQNPLYFIAFGFGSGLIPFAPGTWGTLAAVPLYLLLIYFSPFYYLLITIGLFCAGIWLCEKVSRDLQVHDYPGIVWDEVVGYLLTMYLMPPSLIWMILGFLLFRIIDIWKPIPISLIDRHVRGGLGIMLDDALAAIFACLILHGIYRVSLL